MVKIRNKLDKGSHKPKNTTYQDSNLEKHIYDKHISKKQKK